MEQSQVQGLWCRVRVWRLDKGSSDRLERTLNWFQLSMEEGFLHIILVQFILFFISYWCKTASVARNGINSFP